MRILITGAFGFLGRNLVDHLEHDHGLILVDRETDLFETEAMSKWMIGKHIVFCDLQKEAEKLQEILPMVDCVIHCAARTRIPPSWNHYLDYYKMNMITTTLLYNLCQAYGVKKFVFISSSSVYGNNGTDTQTVDSPLMPTNPYAVSKMSAEHALNVQRLMGNTELVIVRPFTMYGDYMNLGPDALVIGKFIKARDNKEPLQLDGGGTQTRDFLHASDAVVGMKLILENSKDGDIFNLGTGRSVTIKQLADIISPKQVNTPPRRGHVERTQADITALKALGYEAKVDVLEWLTELMSGSTIDR